MSDLQTVACAPDPWPGVLTRSEWGAPKSVPRGVDLAPTRIVVHHPAQGYSYASRENVSRADVLRAAQQVERSHKARAGFGGQMGYHFLILGDGTVVQGRAYMKAGTVSGDPQAMPRLAQGVHARADGANRNAIGVCVLGCFGDRTDKTCPDTPSPAALASLRGLLARLCSGYRISPSRIVGHRDLPGAATACPGDRLHAKLPEIRKAVAAAL